MNLVSFFFPLQTLIEKASLPWAQHFLSGSFPFHYNQKAAARPSTGWQRLCNVGLASTGQETDMPTEVLERPFLCSDLQLLKAD